MFEMSELDSLKIEDKRPERRSTSETGSKGERIAAKFLVRNGYRLVMSNFTVPIGRNNSGAQVKGEIDIVALDGETLCFIEVKTRRSDEFTGPLTSVDLHKQRVVTRSARMYRRIFAIGDMRYRFDVVTVIDDGQSEPRIEIFKNYWTEGKFKKRIWADGAY